MIARLLGWIAALGLAVAGHAGPAAAAPSGRFVDLPRVASRLIAPPHVTIWLPPGYDRGHRRYGVIYMQDGQNLFFPAKSGLNKVWAADRSIARLSAAGTIDPVIIVGIWNPGANRARQYYPQALYAMLPDWAKASADQFTKGTIFSDTYLQFLVTELKPMIDRHYRTRHDPAHTVIAGSSMGGLISLYALAEYPQVFGAAACVSTHWPLANPVMTDAQRAALLAVWDRYLETHLGAANGRHIWFDHGDQTLDQYYGAYQSHIDRTLVRIGWQPHSDFETRAYPGAAHEENSWAARLDDVFGWVLGPHAG